MIDILTKIAFESWEVLLQSAPFMLFGFFVAGLLKAFVGPEFISKNLGSGKISDVFKASLLGVPIPLCSCGVIPAAAQLRQQGASKGATTSFLISTPETGVDSIAVTYALLDPIMTILRPVAAFITAVIAGIMVDRNEKKNGTPPQLIPDAILFQHTHEHDHAPSKEQSCSNQTGCSGCGCEKSESPSTFMGKVSSGMKYSFGNLLQDIGLWFIFGVILAGMFGALIPDGFIEKNLGDGFMPLLIMLAAAVPLYVCATASTPIAAALALKGLSPGAALVFLLAGPATNAASFTVIAKLLGKRSAFIYLGTIIVCSLLLGMLTNWLYYSFGLSITDWVQGGAEDVHGIFYTVSAIVLIALIAVPRLTTMINGKSESGHSH
ncbi:SO_0444 family Cu/Zn efflux transporter [Maridesulfovibrio ferrireducens]|uniref:SO_0444 family Cu/Zn efflux transporter n=1 Tax=Maridesulfovibrio ferrireducens TaxID=246191 RepID=UPI001A2CE89B|nr:SO_0444 family Cu/Zn efflux transporter [Maridesulfovibrio ferrireducens]MBI9110899.1 SO_0444 family Cu/Zn efflux transporter [Maridesulfovibrio ferrireducens]